MHTTEEHKIQQYKYTKFNWIFEVTVEDAEHFHEGLVRNAAKIC